jgi:YidC/Oxa1 family membrane protein insertase
MEKRLLLAIGLSLLIMVFWSRLTSRFYPIENKDVKIQTTPSLSSKTSVSLPPSSVAPEISDKKKINADLDNQQVVFNEGSASIGEIRFRDYQDYRFALGGAFWLQGPGLAFQEQGIGKRSVFIHQDAQKRIRKQIDLSASYSGRLSITIENLSQYPLDINYPLILSNLDFQNGQFASRFHQIVIQQKEKTLRLNPRKQFISASGIKFLAVRTRYFCAIIQPLIPQFRGFINKINHKRSEIGLLYHFSLLPGTQKNLEFRIYLGPQDLDLINLANPQWQSVVYYGAFDSIGKILLGLLKFFEKIVHNWGIAIILLSVSIYFVLFPLSIKQMRSMKRMQGLQPQIEYLRKTYKDNPQRMNKEILELYKREKVNPVSGCLPMLLQIPIFFSLYQTLMRSIELKGGHFLWIKDLSEPDRLIVSPEINILPILMAIVMYLQQKTTAMSGTSTEQQRMMSILFPLLFGFIFYRMPSGLVLYWFVNSLLMFIFQYRAKVQPD